MNPDCWSLPALALLSDVKPLLVAATDHEQLATLVPHVFTRDSAPASAPFCRTRRSPIHWPTSTVSAATPTRTVDENRTTTIRAAAPRSRRAKVSRRIALPPSVSGRPPVRHAKRSP